MQITDWNAYIPHPMCAKGFYNTFGYICHNCLIKNWFDNCIHYGMSEKEATSLIEGDLNGGGGEPQELIISQSGDRRQSAPTDNG